jgi:hypothetical protein
MQGQYSNRIAGVMYDDLIGLRPAVIFQTVLQLPQHNMSWSDKAYSQSGIIIRTHFDGCEIFAVESTVVTRAVVSTVKTPVQV